jgi:hypothetical protein
MFEASSSRNGVALTKFAGAGGAIMRQRGWPAARVWCILLEGDKLGLLLGFWSCGSIWWTRRCLAAGAFMWVMVGGLGRAGSEMTCVGGFRGA